MKRMSIAQFAREFDAAKTRRARISLWFRSLGLRYRLWKGWRDLQRRKSVTHRSYTQSEVARCSTCEGGMCPDCTDPA